MLLVIFIVNYDFIDLLSYRFIKLIPNYVYQEHSKNCAISL